MARMRRTFGGRRRPCADPGDEEAARIAAIAALARRDYTCRALIERLEAAGFAPEAAARAVAVLVAERLVDDERFLSHGIDSRRARGQGPLRIAYELKRDGLAPELVERAVDTAAGEWTAAACALKVRRFGAAAARDRRQRARQRRFLCQRGYTMAQVQAALGGSAEEAEASAADLAWTDEDHVNSSDTP